MPCGSLRENALSMSSETTEGPFVKPLVIIVTENYGYDGGGRGILTPELPHFAHSGKTINHNKLQ